MSGSVKNSEAERAAQIRQEKYRSVCESLLMSARQDRSYWDKLVRITFPELIDVADLQKPETTDEEEPLCSHARLAALTLASAHVSYITPMGERWFQYTPLGGLDSVSAGEYDSADSWFARATQVVQETVERSNFYNEAYAVYIDRIVTGTGAMLCETHKESARLIFSHIPAGTFGIAENELHEVDTLCRVWKATPAQLVGQFGEEAVSDTVRQAYESDRERYTKEIKVYQLVEPRRGKVSGSAGESDGTKMPYRNVYLEAAGGHVIFEGGYAEFPFVVTRFVRYGTTPYGHSALGSVYQEMLDLRKLKSIMMVSAERRAIPSLLVTAEMAGEVDLRAGGQTIVSALDGRADIPRELAPANDARDAMMLMQEQQKEIDDALFKTSLQGITETDKTMSAREVSARMAEKAMTITQSFTQFSVDFYPMQQRIFACVFRLGLMPREGMPRYIVQPVMKGEKVVGERVLAPQVKYCGRMAQILQNAQVTSLNNTISELVELYQATQMPDWLLPLNIPRIVQFKLNGQMFPQQCVKTPDEVESEKRQMQQQQAAQQQVAMAQQAAQANKDNAQADVYREQQG